MKVRQNNCDFCNKNYPKFKGSLYSNKHILNGLKYTAEHAAIVTVGATFAFSTIVRPIITLCTPKVKKKDKQNIFAKSLASGALGFGLTALLFKPIAQSFDNITNNPTTFLSNKTVKKLKDGSKSLDNSSSYNFIKQLTKLSPQFLAVIPKSVLTCFLIPPLTKLFFKEKENNKKELLSPSFKSSTNKLSTQMAKVIENEKLQNAAIKYKDSNFIQHILSLKDAFASSCFAVSTMINQKIDKKDKKPLIYNAFISTGLTIAGGYAVNNAIETPFENFIKKFKTINKNDKDLDKYIAGIKILKPILIMATLYYGIIPIVSTFLAGKLTSDKQKDKIG